MEIFYLTLQQMLTMFVFMTVGFLLRRCRILPENSDKVMATLETFLFVPALSLVTQMNKCTVKSFAENYKLILYGFSMGLVAISIAYLLAGLFEKRDYYQKNIFKYALTFGNYGFMGNFLILSVWGNDMFYKYSLFTLVLGIICNGWGMYILIPKDKNSGLLASFKKAVTKPPIIAIFTGIVLGLTGIAKFMPGFFTRCLEGAGDCQGPVAMVLAGFVIGGYNFKELILNKKVYVVSMMRLIVIPALFMFILKALGAGTELMTIALIVFATPLGLNTIVFPAAFGGDTKTGASMAMISHTLSVITIPLMYLLFIVIL